VGGVIESKKDKSSVLEELNTKRKESDESDSTVMKIAGLYDDWTDSDGKSKRTYTTLTCASCSGFQWLHTRQPVFLTDDLVDEWLDNKVDIIFCCCVIVDISACM
jgi:putative SOS response-associated peptidase YedK